MVIIETVGKWKGVGEEGGRGEGEENAGDHLSLITTDK